MSARHLSSFPLLKNLIIIIGQSFNSIESLHLDPRPAKQLFWATARYENEGLYSKQQFTIIKHIKPLGAPVFFLFNLDGNFNGTYKMYP